MRLVRCWMFERVIGSPVRDCPHALDTRRVPQQGQDAAADADPGDGGPPRSRGHRVSSTPQRVRRAAALAAEPGLFSACGLRSPTGDLTTIRRLLDDGRTALTDIAAQTGIPLEYLHYLIGEFDPSLPQHPSTLDSAVRPSGMPAISRAELIELYEGQQLGLERIGQIYGVSRHTVTHLAHRYGVALRQPGRPYRL